MLLNEHFKTHFISWWPLDTDDVEIVNLGSGLTCCKNSVQLQSDLFPGSSCLKLPDYQVVLYAAAGTFVDGKARICGGDTAGSPVILDCY